MTCRAHQARDILFPAPKGNGDYVIDDTADHNLAGAIEDLTRTGHADVISLRTLLKVLDQLRQAREALG